MAVDKETKFIELRLPFLQKLINDVFSGAIMSGDAVRIARSSPEIPEEKRKSVVNELLDVLVNAGLFTESEFAGLLPDTVMNLIMNAWALFEKGEINREEAVSRIDKSLHRVEDKVTPAVFEKLMIALQAVKAGLAGREQRSANPLLAEKYAEFATPRSIMGVEAFGPGTHKDSRGEEKTWTREEVAKLKTHFELGVPPTVPVKLGHTSEEFNTKVAEALEIPIDVLMGDSGHGAARLGEVLGAHINDDGKLFLDLGLSNDKVANLVEQNFFTGVSVEIQDEREQDGKKFSPVLSGIALLGAERPALAGMAPLQSATLLSDGTKANTIYCTESTCFSLHGISFVEGESFAPPGAATEGDPEVNKLYDVLLRDSTRGRQVIASVSAASESSASRVALRVVENFLLNATGPLGSILGTAIGGVFSARILLGRPIVKLNPLGFLGRIKWKFEEEDPVVELLSEASIVNDFVAGSILRLLVTVRSKATGRGFATAIFGSVSESSVETLSDNVKSEVLRRGNKADLGGEVFIEKVQILGKVRVSTKAAEEALIEIDNLSEGISMTQKTEEATYVWTDGKDHALHDPTEDMRNCVAQARTSGIENPEAHCREKLGVSLKEDEDEDAAMKEVLDALGLPEGTSLEEATKAALGGIKELKEQASGKSSSYTELEKKYGEQDVRIKAMERKEKVADYAEQVADLRISGTKSELAERLMKIEEKAGPEEATAMFDEWKLLDKQMAEAGVMIANLSPAETEAKTEIENHKFNEKVKEVAEENKWNLSDRQEYAQAFSKAAELHPELAQDYSEKVRA